MHTPFCKPGDHPAEERGAGEDVFAPREHTPIDADPYTRASWAEAAIGGVAGYAHAIFGLGI